MISTRAAVRAIVDGPLHLLRIGNGEEIAAQSIQIDRFAGDAAKHDAHEEALGQDVVELLHLHDIQPA